MNIIRKKESEFSFKLADGKILKSVPELLESIRTMEEWVYKHHVNIEKNDFLPWIEYIHKKEEMRKDNKKKYSLWKIKEFFKKQNVYKFRKVTK